MEPKYLAVDGHDLFTYEWANNGEAAVLLHGGLSQTSHWDSYLVPDLEDEFHVFAYDRTGHGFSADRDGSFHFDYQTREAITYLETIVKEPSHLIGFSDGGIIAIMVAIARPDLVKSLVLVGANFHHSGTPDIPEFFPSDEDRAEYALTSPDAPETIDDKFRKMFKVWKTEPDIALSDIATIQCPALVLAGDDDVVDHEHTIELFRALPLGQLAIIPGASHVVMKDKQGLFMAAVKTFLEDLSYPITRMPIKRTNPTLD